MKYAEVFAHSHALVTDESGTFNYPMAHPSAEADELIREAGRRCAHTALGAALVAVDLVDCTDPACFENDEEIAVMAGDGTPAGVPFGLLVGVDLDEAARRVECEADYLEVNGDETTACPDDLRAFSRVLAANARLNRLAESDAAWAGA